MLRWKAIVVGSLGTAVLMLTTQLVFILLAALVGAAKGELSFLAQHKETIWLLLVLFFYCCSMAAGGVLTAYFAPDNPLPNALTVGLLVSCLSLVASLDSGNLSAKSVLAVILGTVSAVIGSLIWRRWMAPR